MTDENLKIAKQVKRFLDGHARPREATVSEIAEGIGADPDQVAEILDSHAVNERGKVEHVGSGSGGGWVPQEDDSEG